MQDDRSQSCFSTSLEQRTMMRMRICKHCQQTGRREISLATIFRHCFLYETFIPHLTNLVVYKPLSITVFKPGAPGFL